MRFTIIDADGSVSCTGPGHALKALAAAVSLGAADTKALLDGVIRFDDRFGQSVRNELAVFDERVVRDDPASVDWWFQQESASSRAFRVFNQRMRNLSLQAAGLGIVLFNLPERRIVQIENAYGSLQRSDRSRYRVDGIPKPTTYAYSLPQSWQILP